MKRTQDKIKDIVEPQDFDEVRNVVSDPARSLAAYCFTDATSDLLARWLDALADLPRGRGAARSLAGVRGVGKSHALAVFGALAAQERLRLDVSDAHVATSARRLSGRRYMVVRVERGTRDTLAEEMAAAFGRAFGGSEAQWGTDPAGMLAVAGSRAHDSTLVLIIDTGFDRPSRVRRDDGTHLGEIARTARGANAFVALALDDDISGADGPNVAIAGTYHIDFLDHEHLFRIADTYILHKNERGRAALHDIYLHLRASVPGFNWSEPRFAALYPVHPLVADVAAAVRLYAPTFAFLPFAAEAARRATSRPALSLVLLDEVFDRAERDLRKSPELKEAFEAYDDLATRVVAQFPVMQRLEAKLVLKTLFILSLDGGGATPQGLCAALLVSQESAPAGGAARVSEMLDRFVEAAPEALRVGDEAAAGDGPRYRLQIGALDKFQTALERSVERLPDGSDSLALTQLRAAAHARFEDWPFADGHDEQTATANFNLAWRGSERRARMVWVDAAASPPAAAPDFDLEVFIYAPGAEATPAPPAATDEDAGAAPLSVVWRPGEVTAEELTTLRRLLALRTDGTLAADFTETAVAAETVLAAQAQRVWARIYLDAGTLEVGGERKSPDDRARGSRTLSAALSTTLAPHFAELYPQHPQFAETLRDADVERLSAGLFAGAGASDAEVERLARVFALPLGLVERRGNEHILAPGDDGADDPAWVKEVLRLVAHTDAASAPLTSASPATVPLESIRGALRRPPYGLQREAQNLLLAALAAQRRIELFDASGERALRPGRPLNWDEVASVAPAAQQGRDPEQSAAWARLLTGRPDLRALSDREARGAASMALSEWLERWRALKLGERFDALPDALLTTRVWRMNAEACRRFGAAAEAVRLVLASELSLDEGLERVADAFDNSADTLAEAAHDLDALTQFVENCVARRRAAAYLLTAGQTGVDEIEAARRELLSIARERACLFDAERNERFNRLWPEFQTLYAEHYAAAHDAAGAHTRRALDTLLAGDRWREFEMLSRLPFVTRQYWEAARELLRRAGAPRCDLPVRQLLAARTACACGFKLSGADAASRLPREFEEVLESGLAGYRRTLALLAAPLRRALEALAGREEERRETATRARILAAAFGAGTPPRRFSRADAQLIERAAAEMGAPPSVRASVPTDGGQLLTRDELSARLQQWLDDLPANAALVELVAGGSETHA
ncbi:MAG TPA: hypothetical protein VF240_20155 [Pyrinomonadaceae bacterium]